MAERVLPAEHPRDLGHRLLLHRGAGAAAVERVVVGIDPHRERIRRPSQGVRRFEHLPRVKRMEVRVVVAQPPCDLIQHGGGSGHVERRSVRRRQRAEARLESRQRRQQTFE